jgi:hypothetical protein
MRKAAATKVLKQYFIRPGDKLWATIVAIVRRDVKKGDRTRSYINVELTVGQKKLAIPHRYVSEIGEALIRAGTECKAYLKGKKDGVHKADREALDSTAEGQVVQERELCEEGHRTD